MKRRKHRSPSSAPSPKGPIWKRALIDIAILVGVKLTAEFVLAWVHGQEGWLHVTASLIA